MLGPYIKSRATGGTKMSVNADLITVETYVQGKTIENQWAKMFYFLYFWLFEGPWGPVFLSSYPLTNIYVHMK